MGLKKRKKPEMSPGQQKRQARLQVLEEQHIETQLRLQQGTGHATYAPAGRSKNVELTRDWMDGTGYDVRKDPRWVRENGTATNYPGCGTKGRCMPCGEKFVADSKGVLVCRTWLKHGCPVEAKAEHFFNVGKDRHICSRCNCVKGWVSQRTGRWYATRRLASFSDEREEDLIRGDGG